jgi:hypothetical protein
MSDASVCFFSTKRNDHVSVGFMADFVCMYVFSGILLECEAQNRIVTNLPVSHFPLAPGPFEQFSNLCSLLELHCWLHLSPFAET